MTFWVHLALASLWGGLLALERRAFLQAMLSRPLVAATGTGFLLGDFRAGLFIGTVLELFYLDSAGMGASQPENDTLSAVGTAAAAASLGLDSGSPSTPALWSSALLLFVGLGRAGRWMDRLLEGHSTERWRRAVAELEAGELRRAMRENLWAMWPHFVLAASVTAACALAGVYVARALDYMPLRTLRGLAWAYPAMASVAAAVAVRGARVQGAVWYAAFAAAAVILGTVLFSIFSGLA